MTTDSQLADDLQLLRRAAARAERPGRGLDGPAQSHPHSPDKRLRTGGNRVDFAVPVEGSASGGSDGMKLSIERGALLKARGAGAVGGRTAQHHPDPRQRADRGRRRRSVASAPPIWTSRWWTAPRPWSNAPGATTVSAVMLHEIVRKLPDGALVTLTDDARGGPADHRGGPVAPSAWRRCRRKISRSWPTSRVCRRTSRPPRRCCGGCSTRRSSRSRPKRRAIT